MTPSTALKAYPNTSSAGHIPAEPGHQSANGGISSIAASIFPEDGMATTSDSELSGLLGVDLFRPD